MSEWQTPPAENRPAPPPVSYTYQAPPPRPRTGRKVVLAIVIVLLVLTLVVSGLVNFVLLAALGAQSATRGRLEEVYVSGSGPDKVAIVEVQGLLMEEAGFFGGGSYNYISEQLKQAAEDDSVRAVILEVNSPGGGVTASDILAHKVLELKDKKTVTVSMKGLAASGGYYISAPADRIYAYPTTITGSIGVIWTSLNASKLMDKVGLADETVKSGPLKDFGSPFRPMTPEDRAVIEGIIQDAFVRFKDVVAKGRKDLTLEEVDALATGAVYPAQEAKRLKLIDEIGYLDDAIQGTKSLAGLSQARVVRYRKRYTLMDILGARSQAGSPEVRLRLEGAPQALPPGLYYVWAPALSTTP